MLGEEETSGNKKDLSEEQRPNHHPRSSPPCKYKGSSSFSTQQQQVKLKGGPCSELQGGPPRHSL